MEPNEIIQIQSGAPEEGALGIVTRAEISSAVATAKNYPRSLANFLTKALTMATINEEVAESCSFVLPRGGKSIEGQSVRFAEIICSCYGNIRAGARVIENDGKTITAQGICIDLESNYSVTVDVKRKITDKQGRTYSEDMQVMAGNAACAIAYRNAVFKVVPSALTNDIFEKVKEVAKGTVETVSIKRDKALAYFQKAGITNEQVFDLLGVKGGNEIDIDMLQKLRGMVSAIKNGETTIKDLFEKPDAGVVPEETRSESKATLDGLKNKPAPDVKTEPTPDVKLKDEAAKSIVPPLEEVVPTELFQQNHPAAQAPVDTKGKKKND